MGRRRCFQTFRRVLVPAGLPGLAAGIDLPVPLFTLVDFNPADSGRLVGGGFWTSFIGNFVYRRLGKSPTDCPSRLRLRGLSVNRAWVVVYLLLCRPSRRVFRPCACASCPCGVDGLVSRFFFLLAPILVLLASPPSILPQRSSGPLDGLGDGKWFSSTFQNCRDARRAVGCRGRPGGSRPAIALRFGTDWPPSPCTHRFRVLGSRLLRSSSPAALAGRILTVMALNSFFSFAQLNFCAD